MTKVVIKRTTRLNNGYKRFSLDGLNKHRLKMHFLKRYIVVMERLNKEIDEWHTQKAFVYGPFSKKFKFKQRQHEKQEDNHSTDYPVGGEV